MSTVLTRVAPPTSVSTGRYLRAQARIWARVGLLGVPGAVAVFMLVTCAVQFSTGRHGFDDALGFLNLWVVAAGPLMVAVFAAHLAHLDRAARSGGLDMRGADPRLRVVGPTVVLVAWTAVVHVVAIGIWCLVTVLVGADVSPGHAVGTAAGIVVALIASYLWLCAALAAAGLLAPVVGPSVVGFVTVVIGIVFAESPGWQLIPPTWVMRSTLDAIGTHVNGTSLGGAHLPAGPAPFIGSVVLAIAVVVVASLIVGGGVPSLSRRRAADAHQTGPRDASTAAITATRTRPTTAPPVARSPRSTDVIPAVRLRTVVRIVSGPTVPVLAVVSVLFVALTLRWRPASDAASVFALFVLPMGAVVTAALWVARVRTGARGLSTRPQRPESIGSRLLLVADAVVAVVVVAVSVVFVAAGAPLGPVLRAAVVFWCVGAMLVAASALITARFGPVPAIAFGIIGTVFGTLVGGTSMYSTLGVIIPFAWAAHPNDGAALITTPIAVVAAVVLSIIAARGIYRVRRS